MPHWKSVRARVVFVSVAVTLASVVSLTAYQSWIANARREVVARTRRALRFDLCRMRSLDALSVSDARSALGDATSFDLPLEARVVAVLEDIQKRDFLLAQGELTALSEVGASNGLVRLLSAYWNREQGRNSAVLRDSGVAAELQVPELEGGQLALLSMRLEAALAEGDTALAARTLRELENRFADTNRCPALSFRRAQVAELEGDYQAAHAELETLLELDPEDVVAWIKLAQLDERLELDVDARTHYLRALRLANANALAHASFALFLASQGDADRALAHAQRATELDPNLASAWAARGEVSRLQGNFASAAEHLRRALEHEPDNATFVFKLAMAYAGLAEWVEASHHFERAATLRPTLAAAFNGTGVARMQLMQRNPHARAENLELARAAFARARELDPSDPNPVRNLARLQSMSEGLRG